MTAAPQAPKQVCVCGGRTAKQLSRQWVESSLDVFLPLSFQEFIRLFVCLFSSEIYQENEIKVKKRQRQRDQSVFNLNSFFLCEKATVRCKIFIFIMVGIIIDGEALQTNEKISVGVLNPDELSLHLAFLVLGEHGLQFFGCPS